MSLFNTKTGKPTMAMTAEGVKGFSSEPKEDGTQAIKFFMSNGEKPVDEGRKAAGLEPEEASAKAPPEFMPIFTAFRDDGTAALELDAPNASDKTLSFRTPSEDNVRTAGAPGAPALPPARPAAHPAFP